MTLQTAVQDGPTSATTADPAAGSTDARPDIALRVPWIFRPPARILVSLAAGLCVGLITSRYHPSIRVVVTFDVAAITYVALFFGMATRATPEEAAEFARRREPAGRMILVAAIVMSLVSFVVVPALQVSLKDPHKWLMVTDIAASLLALFLSWTIVHIVFGLEYMRMHYDDDDPTLGDRSIARLEFPSRPVPDFWDFMYFTFTIAMCYGTSDVTIHGHPLRRLTLLHGLFSFFYVIVIIGLVVSIVDNAV